MLEHVPQLWNDLQNQIEESGIMASVYWGVVDTSTGNEQFENITYWAGFESDKVKNASGMKICDVPEQTYACFTHKGPLNTLDTTINAIFSWLPESGYLHTGGMELELYDERFVFNHPDSVMEYWVPVEKEV